jgi:DNA polymerase-3 subunit gamma/tau
MRDALSVLDQCLSFGEGAVTAQRVREVLGLVGDELYAEVLDLVADRRPEGVFPLVDRLVNAGADLAEFMGGAGEALRALLMLQLGSAPEGLTEALRGALELHRDRLEPGDLLRMLRLLADSETAIRRSTNPRLIVETLLLRWTMLDRIVDLAQVLARGESAGGGPAGGGSVGRPSPRVTSAAVPPSVAPPLRSAQGDSGGTPDAASSPPAEPIPATLEALQASWPAIVADVRERSRFLGEALSHTAPAALDLPWLTVALAEPNPLFAERLQTQAQLVEEVVGQAIGQAARLRVTEAGPPDGAPPQKPRKLTEASLKADRLRAFRSKDPTLDTAADALDLEIVD